RRSRRSRSRAPPAKYSSSRTNSPASCAAASRAGALRPRPAWTASGRCACASKRKSRWSAGRRSPSIEPGDSMQHDARPWYRGVTSYQWLVLALASAGWVFDVYEGQIFSITRATLLADLLAVPQDDPAVTYYADLLQAPFLIGGALGGVLFGLLADRLGRRPVLIATILTYSIFSGLTYLAQSVWQVTILRFLVAVGTGGEWSVAAALVAEVFSTKARAQAGAIFHATSVIGTWLAGLTG